MLGFCLVGKYHKPGELNSIIYQIFAGLNSTKFPYRSKCYKHQTVSIFSLKVIVSVYVCARVNVTSV